MLTGLTTCLFYHGPDNPLLQHTPRLSSIQVRTTTKWFNTHSHRDDSSNNRWAWHHRWQKPTLKHNTTKAITQVSGSSEDTERFMDFGFSGACMNIAKVEYRGHEIHGNTLVSFTVLVFRMRDKKIKQRSITEVSRFQTRGSGKMENEPPTQLTSIFNCMHPGRHLSSWSCMLPFFHTSCMHCLSQELRIKNTCLSHSFGIIINYYSQGLKPLRLAPLSNLSTPFPLPTLWKLSPPSLFLRGQSVRNDV
jgi:hypothetical protein